VTVTLHDFFGPRLVPVQVSAVILNAAAGVPADGVSVIFSAEVAEPPELLSVNTLGDAVEPGAKAP